MKYSQYDGSFAFTILKDYSKDLALALFPTLQLIRSEPSHWLHVVLFTKLNKFVSYYSRNYEDAVPKV